MPSDATFPPPPVLSRGALRLLEAAEELIGKRGLEAVSMRQIVTAAGQSNPGAVQYHFGSLDGLIEAIYRLRLPVIEARRAELLAELSPTQRTDLRCLLRSLALPFTELCNSKGKLSYARFAAEMGLTTEMPAAWVLPAAEFAPATHELIALTRQAMPPGSPEKAALRVTLALQLIFRGLDGNQYRRFPGLAEEDVFEEALTMAAAALAAV
jgi:AcrR family transcriptional regulator